jgi:nitroreductase
MPTTLYENILTRRSIRSFKKQDIPRETVEKIVEAGLAAPSSKNSNPWYFLVVEGREKEKIADWVIEKNKQKTNIPLDPKTGKPSEKLWDSTSESASIVREAGILILVFNSAPFSGGYQRVIEKIIADKNLEYLNAVTVETIGIGAASENILLASHFLGLGGVCLRDISICEQKIKDYFKINYDLALGIAIGYPRFIPPKRVLRKELIQYTPSRNLKHT